MAGSLPFDNRLFEQEERRVRELRQQFMARRMDVPTQEEKDRGFDRLRETMVLLDVFQTPRFVSHYPVIGGLIGRLKCVVVAVMNRFLRVALPRQIEFNQKVWNEMLRLSELERRVEQLEHLMKQSHDRADQK